MKQPPLFSICDKFPYNTPEEALAAYKVFSKSKPGGSDKRKKHAKRMYTCPICGKYHLTSRKGKKTLNPKEKVKYKNWY